MSPILLLLAIFDFSCSQVESGADGGVLGELLL
jgi:hypothetical protein